MTIPVFQLLMLKPCSQSYLTLPHSQSIIKSNWLYLQNISRIPTASYHLYCYHSGLGWNIWILSSEHGRIIKTFRGLGGEATHAYSIMLEPAHTSSQDPTSKFSATLQDSWHHGNSINLTMVGIFITWILANIINQDAPLHAPYPTLMLWMCNIYQHTIVCANLYYRKVILVMWFSTGVYICEHTLESPKELFSPYICLPAWTHWGPLHQKHLLRGCWQWCRWEMKVPSIGKKKVVREI